MRLGIYRFDCVMIDDAILPVYKGSTFRGAFGVALKKVVCAVRNDDCRTCLLASRCLYAKTFEPSSNDNAGSSRLATAPHPYVIEPPLSAATRYRPGDPFDFSLLLFGDTNDFLPYFIYAFESMGETGIGKKLGGKRSGYKLVDLKSEGVSIYDASRRKLQVPPALRTFRVPAPDPAAAQTGTLTVNLKTPLRLKMDNRLSAELPFHLLVRALLRRVSSLMEYYGAGEPSLDYRGLVARAATVKIAESDLQWFDWKRYSNRQDEAMLMGGVMGSIKYRGSIGEFLPLIELGRVLHIGKQTSFGLGLFDYSWRAEAE